MFVVKEAVRAIKASPVTFTMAVVALAIAVGLAAFLGNAAYRAHQHLSSVRANLKVEAFFDPALSSDEVATVAYQQIVRISGVRRYEVTTKEQALEEFQRSSGENVAAILGMNPLPASVRVFLKDPTERSARSVTSQLRAIRGVAEVRSDEQLLATLESRTHLLIVIASIFGGLTLLATIFFLMLAARQTLSTRSETLRVLRLLGATNRQLTVPLLFEASAIGVLGGLLGSLLLWAVQHFALDELHAEVVNFTSIQNFGLVVALCVALSLVLSLIANTLARVSYRV